MSLGDPFGVTAQLAQEGVGGGIQAATDPIFAQVQKKQNQTDALSLLKQFGMVSPEGILDTNKAANMGLELDPISGAMKIAPKRPEKTAMDSLLEYKAVQDKAKEIGVENADISVGKGGVTVKPKGSGGFGAANIAFAEKNAPIIYEALKRGDVSGYMNATSQAKTAISALAAQEGINIDDLVLGYKADQTAMGNVRIADNKVTSGIYAQTLLDSSYDPTTGEYKVPPSMHVELALAVARMMSPQGVVSQELVEELRQVTAREGLAGAAIWLGFDPKEVGGTTQSVINLFAKTIDREATAAEDIREKFRSGQTSSYKEFKAKSNKGKSVTDVAGLTPTKKYVKTGKNKKGQKVGQLADGTIEVINE